MNTLEQQRARDLAARYGWEFSAVEGGYCFSRKTLRGNYSIVYSERASLPIRWSRLEKTLAGWQKP